MGNTLNFQGPDATQVVRDIKELPFALIETSKSSEPTDQSFSVLSYNILADAYKHVFLFAVKCKFLDFQYRSRIIMEELKKFSCDIICLQEVDHYDDFYRAELSHLGYDLVYQQKNKRKDGCVIGVKKELFERISTKTMNLDKGHNYEHKSDFIRGNIVLIATYRHKPSGKIINVINTHFFWDPKFEHVKYLQMSEIKKFINKNFTENDIVIWSGDLNSRPFSNTVECILKDSPPQLEKMDFKVEEKHKVMEDIYTCLQTEPSKIKLANAYSIYGNLLNNDSITYPDYTNYTHQFQGTFDHICYTEQNLIVKNLLKIPTPEEIVDKGLPNWRYPSDHLPIIVKFDFLDMKSKLCI